MTDALMPDVVEPLLRTAWLGQSYVFLPETRSTNRVLDRLAREGAPEGMVVVADAQHAGRGRLGRRWVSPGGVNLYLSVLLRPAWAASEPRPVSVAVGVALAEALAPFLPGPPLLKWPNDLLVNGKKLAGILVEVNVQGTTIQHMVIGVGINVNQEVFDDALADRATSLRRETNRTIMRATVLAAVLAEMERQLDDLNRGASDAICARWTNFATWLGTEVTVSTPQGVCRGVALGLAADGTLRLQHADGSITQVVAGDVG